jgi:hypothetical protein
MMGAEIVIGVIIGVLFELFSNAEGTPLTRESNSNFGTVEDSFITIEIANAALITR